MWKKEGNKYKVVNIHGDLVSAKPVRRKMKCVLHKTIDGRWIKKVVAVRNNIELTGEKKLFSSGYWNTFNI